MVKKFRTIVILTIILSMVFGLTSSVLAGQNASNCIHSKSAAVTAIGSGKVKITFTVTGTGLMDMIGAYSIVVYGSDGSESTYTYDMLGYGNMMGGNTVMYSNNINHQGSRGVSYYAVVTVYAKDFLGQDDSAVYTTTSVVAY